MKFENQERLKRRCRNCGRLIEPPGFYLRPKGYPRGRSMLYCSERCRRSYNNRLAYQRRVKRRTHARKLRG